MNRRELNLSTMFQTVEEFLNKNSSSFEDKPLMKAAIADLKQCNATIHSLNEAQSVSTRADFAIKAEDRKMLLDNGLKVSDGLKAIAAMNKDTRLKVEADVSRWELGRLRENDMLIRLKQLHATAQPYMAELLALGVEASVVDSLDSDSSKLMQTSPAIRNIKVKTRQATIELGETVISTNNLIRETLDPMMLPFKNINPTLYGEYQNARKVADVKGGRSTKESTELKPEV